MSRAGSRIGYTLTELLEGNQEINRYLQTIYVQSFSFAYNYRLPLIVFKALEPEFDESNKWENGRTYEEKREINLWGKIVGKRGRGEPCSLKNIDQLFCNSSRKPDLPDDDDDDDYSEEAGGGGDNKVKKEDPDAGTLIFF